MKSITIPKTISEALRRGWKYTVGASDANIYSRVQGTCELVKPGSPSLEVPFVAKLKHGRPRLG